MSEKRKTLEEMRAEKEQAETRLLQERHKLNRLENRLHYYEQGERAKRTHRLCNLGGAVESLAPQVKTFSKTEIFELMESIFSLPEVQSIEPENGCSANTMGSAATTPERAG